MHIAALYIHPIKSLLPVSVPSSALTPLGFPHDRTFVLLRTATLEPLRIGRLSQLCLFSVSLSSVSSVTVTFTPTSDTLEVALTPALGAPINVVMHNSACTGYHASAAADAFFTTHLGFATTLVYLSTSQRQVLGNVAPATRGWFGLARKAYHITFADCAPLLVTTTPSLADVSARCGGDVDIRKFRPNIVVAPDAGEEVEEVAMDAFDEDFWGEVEIAGERVQLTANCARCTSVNVDFDTGGCVEKNVQPLKSLMRDRRVDRGMKYSPVFGRYGFPVDTAGDAVVKVGDKVIVTKRNTERTEFYWPGLSSGTRIEGQG